MIVEKIHNGYRVSCSIREKGIPHGMLEATIAEHLQKKAGVHERCAEIGIGSRDAELRQAKAILDEALAFADLGKSTSRNDHSRLDAELGRVTVRSSAVAAPVARGKLSGVLDGHAAVWHRPGDAGSQYALGPRYFERVDRRAFDRHLASGENVAGLFNHDKNLILGTTANRSMILDTDDVGLRFRLDPAKTTVGQDVTLLVGRGDLKGCSFGFLCREADVVQEGGNRIRLLRDCHLLDCGPVFSPAYTSTSVSVV